VLRILFLFLLLAGSLQAQQIDPANVEKQDPADEIGKFKKNCPSHPIGCGEVVFTGQPIHVTVGNLAPQNGFAGGMAYVGHHDTENWSTSWSADGVASGNGSWRAGVSVKFIDTHLKAVTPVFGTKDATDSDFPVYVEQPVYSLYVQSTSLNKLGFFGLGPDTTTAGRSFFGMTEHIVGGSFVHPLYARLNMGVYGEVNGRAVDIRGNHDQSSPSIEQIYTALTAPGLANQPFFLQLGAGVRMRPTAFNNLLHFDYDVAYRPYFGVSDSTFSFQKLTANLYHEISLYRTNMRVLRDTNGPNDCSIDPTTRNSGCPKVTMKNLEGTLGLRAFTSLAMTPSGNVVPFYFQPTLGGGDINGQHSLSSYQDYRFRAPNILLFSEAFEHSLGKLPLGFILQADQAKLALNTSDLGSNHWKHSYATGITLRAGGFPYVSLLFAFGGKEGTHTLANVNASLAGTAGRPSLF